MQLPHDSGIYFHQYNNNIYQKKQPFWSWVKAYTPDNKTFHPFYNAGTCKDYIIDSFIGHRISYDNPILQKPEAQQQNCVLIVCDLDKKKQLLSNLNTFNEFCAKQGTKPSSIIEIDIPRNKYLQCYAVMGDNIWSKNAFIYSIYLTMIRLIHYQPLTNEYFTHEMLKKSHNENIYLLKWSHLSKYTNLIINAFVNPSQYFEDLPDKYDVRGFIPEHGHGHGQYGPFNILNSLMYLNTPDQVYEKNYYKQLIKNGYFYKKFQDILHPIVPKLPPKKRAVPTMPVSGFR